MNGADSEIRSRVRCGRRFLGAYPWLGGRLEQFRGPQALKPAVTAGECLLEGGFGVDLPDAGEVLAVLEFEDRGARGRAPADLTQNPLGVQAKKGRRRAFVSLNAFYSSAESADVLESNRQGRGASEVNRAGVIGISARREAVVVLQVLQLPFHGECSPAMFSVTGMLRLAVT